MKSEWKTKTVGELTSYIAKGIPPKYAEVKNNATIYVLNQKCNRDYVISYEQARLHDISIKAVPNDKMLRFGDIVINSTGTGTAGRIAQFTENNIPTTVDGHMIIMRPTKEIDYLYYGYALKAYQSKIESLAEGSTGQTEINKQRLQDEISICYPEDILLQHSIAETLLFLDNKIELNNKINENLEMQAQAIFKSWFVDFEPFGGVMPDDWRIGTISEICGYSKDKVDIDDLTLDTYYSTENMRPNRQGAVQATTLPTIKQITACKKGDVLISNIRPYFKKILYCFSDCGCSTDVLCFVPNKAEYSAFLYCTLYADKFFDYMIAGSKGTKMPRGDKQQIMMYPICIPSTDYIQKFNQAVAPMLETVYTNRVEANNLANLRDTLLPKLMNGEIDVSKVKI